MKVVTIESIKGSDRDVKGVGFRSIRAVLARDGVGFSVNKTVIQKGGPYHWNYKSHFETCYCICGQGIITSRETGQRHDVKPDTVYTLDKNDDHEFEALTEVILISIFNPPLTGREIHLSDGSYPLVTELFRDE